MVVLFLIMIVGLFCYMWESYLKTINNEEYINPMDSRKINYRRGGGEFARMSKKVRYDIEGVKPLASSIKPVTARSKST